MNYFGFQPKTMFENTVFVSFWKNWTPVRPRHLQGVIFRAHSALTANSIYGETSINKTSSLLRYLHTFSFLAKGGGGKDKALGCSCCCWCCCLFLLPVVVFTIPCQRSYSSNSLSTITVCYQLVFLLISFWSRSRNYGKQLIKRDGNGLLFSNLAIPTAENNEFHWCW